MTVPEDALREATRRKRTYSARTLKILFALCGNECAHPECTNSIIEDATEFSETMVVGQISHIYASSDNGPRGNPNLSDRERDEPQNLILFCPTHHVIIDGQHETYTASLLKGWKHEHERKVKGRLSASIKDVGYAELEVTARALLAGESKGAGQLWVVPPADKIKKNGLSGESAFLLTLGSAKSREVESVLVGAGQLDAEFAERLRAGFVAKYQELKKKVETSDEVFFGLYAWASGPDRHNARQGAGLCILSHLFIICDVFEK